MKKILVVLNGGNTENTILFACYMAGFTKAKLVGIFPNVLPYAEEPVLKQIHGMAYVESIVESDLSLDESYKRDMEKQQVLFEETCSQKGIPFHVVKHKPTTSQELVAESRLADMIIIDSKSDVTYQKEEDRNKLTNILLTDAECPVIIAPEFFEPVEELVICYDGSASAAFAMKQLAYLLPEMEHVKATALRIGKADDQTAEENKRLREWLSGNFRYTDVVTIDGTPDKELFNFLLKKTKIMVVMGAYGRNIISRFFRQSKADILIDSLPCPVFITHH